VIVAGLAIGGRRAKITTAQTRLQIHSVYRTVIFPLKSVVFSLPHLLPAGPLFRGQPTTIGVPHTSGVPQDVPADQARNPRH
jgi:hypothetical protein